MSVVWVLLAALLAGAVYEGWSLYRVAGFNRLIAQPAKIEVEDSTAPELVYAKACDLASHGDRQEALRLFSTLMDRGDETFRARVRYNLGTLYLRDAAALWNAKGVLEYVRVNTLVAAAKENLREALRLNPDHWDARYNLEHAYRITPPPKEKPKADFQGSKGSVFATVPSIPGGGP
ncbi:tetratricopeptide repeat protein [Methylomagnum sp.]